MEDNSRKESARQYDEALAALKKKGNIETEDEYNIALERSELLMDVGCLPFSDEAKELEELVTIIETYEEIHYPIGKPEEQCQE